MNWINILQILIIIFIVIYMVYFRPLKIVLQARLNYLNDFSKKPYDPEWDKINGKELTKKEYKQIKSRMKEVTGRNYTNAEIFVTITDIYLGKQGFNPKGYDNEKLRAEYIRLKNLVNVGQTDGKESFIITEEKLRLIKQEVKNRKLKIY